MDPVRPSFPQPLPNTPTGGAPKTAAQKAFFDMAMGRSHAPQQAAPLLRCRLIRLLVFWGLSRLAQLREEGVVRIAPEGFERRGDRPGVERGIGIIARIANGSA